MIKTYFLFFLILLIEVLASCTPSSEENKPKVQLAYYHWESHYSPTKETKEHLDSLNFQKVYLHLFDVKWDEQYSSKPVAQLATYWPVHDSNRSVVPVVYIENRVLLENDSSYLQDLAEKVYSKSLSIFNKTIGGSFNEFQIDCDWTLSTKDKYFYFLQRFREQMQGNILSCTIRLYPFKYQKTMGVPPVDRGMLMYYNMGALKDISETNSILNNIEGEKYLRNVEYPLPLDAAVPIFSWSVMFRDGEYMGLIYSVETNEWDSLSFVRRIGDNRFEITRDTTFNDIYFRQGDLVRTEEVTKENVQKGINLLQNVLNDNATISIYQFSDVNHENEDLISFIVSEL